MRNDERWFVLLVSLGFFALSGLPGRAEEGHAAGKSTEALTEMVRPSLVTLYVTGRAGEKEASLGTGFVISANGLIATNEHVLGQGHPVTAEFYDGKTLDVESLYAVDRKMDLAIVKVKADNLPILELGDSSTVKDGQSVVVFGNPEGLKHSVVEAVVSGQREIMDGVPMLQLAMPIERGNSGGPVVDRSGRVVGIVTLKAVYTRNLGFAVEVNSLKPLVAKPNPIGFKQWLTIGALNSKEWKTLFGSNWRQRAGRILVNSPGDGFGGRSLCLSEMDTPKLPFEVAVSVKLDDESGAAGLAFHSDGKHRHYGFYPTGGQMRLTRFEGPTVYTWTILDQQRHPHYKAGDWNRLRVRFEKEKFTCFVNDHKVFESQDKGLTTGQVGLAKFRHTQAEFRGFKVGNDLAIPKPSAKQTEKVAKAVWTPSPERFPSADRVKELADEPEVNSLLLRREADALQARIAYVKELSQQLHRQQIVQRLTAEMGKKEEEVDLLIVGLLIARTDNREVDIEAYQALFERMVTDLRAGLPADADERTKLKGLHHFMFRELAFHGSRTEYYHASNSYINEVIDDREGLPIALSVIYMELGRRIGLSIEGVGLPGHFVVRCRFKDGTYQLIDVFESGKPLDLADAKALVLQMSGRPLVDSDLKASPKRAIALRMIRNLLGLAQREENVEKSLQYLDLLLALEPTDASFRMMRGYFHYQRGDYARSLVDVQWLLNHEPADINIRRVEELHKRLHEEMNR